MKKSYLVLCILTLVFSYHSQTVRVDYDNSSKWFLGFNVGGTWNTTDVSNRTDAGWGLILGKSYGFKSYSPFTFDIRARYLRGFWYGQDSDTSSLAGYSGSALSNYTNQGFTVHNFQSDVHRLGLELAIHMNRITSRTGWDPYIFGGIGLTWHQTYSDLINQNDTTGGSIYNYSSMLANSTQLSDQLENTLDAVYDSPLDGYKSDSYNVAFMPSLGFGLGYHIGKRVTLGVEHKTTFTLRDDFDGLVSTVRPKNDLYHYTSLYLRFRFRGKQPRENVSNAPCYTPSISIIQPTSGMTVTNPQYTIEANLTEVTNSNQISVVNSVGQNVLFNFNSSTKKLTANVLLVPGQNSFTIRVNNRCGSDSKVVSLNFLNCSLPTAIFTSPTTVRDTVRTSAYTVSAAITGISSVQGIKLLQNNAVLNGYSYNAVNGLLQASVNLIPGRNTFTIELFNACGNNTITSEIFFNDCVNPSVTMISPSATGTTVSSPQFNVSALVTGVTDRNQVSISQNSVSTNLFSLVNGKVDLNTVLNTGVNTFIITTMTKCGSASQTFTVNYQTCNAPIITIESPLSNSTVSTSNQTVKAKVINVDSKQNLLVSLNGLALKNFTYTKASNSIEFPVNLTSGLNTISVTATNTCGADVETITITHNPCIAPKISLSVMSSTVTNSAYSYNATILNQASSNGINLTLNGNPINFSYSNNLLSTNVNLQNGVNTFVLSATNQCGSDSKTWSVTNNNCVIPSIVLENPTASGITVNSATFNFKASVIGMSSTQGIQFLVNNIPSSFNYNNGIITSMLNLNLGANTIKLSLQNTCGNDNEDVVINYQNCEAPAISINQPLNTNFTTNQSLLTLNANVTGINGNQGITAKLNGVGIAYQLNSNALSASANLQPGANTIILTATNSCGTDVKAINVNYDNCVQPQVSITNSALTTSNGAFIFNATLTGSNLNQGISLTQNGIVKSYTLNGSALSASVTLTEGLNTFVLSAVNSCGNDSKTYSINYEPCLSPTVLITNPASNNLTFNAGDFTFQSQVSHISLASQIAIIHNGAAVTNFTLNNDQVVASVNLASGNNTIKITVTSTCGSDSKTITLTGKSCDVPVIGISSPVNSTQNGSTYSLQANISNISSNQDIIVKLNDNSIPFQLTNNQIISSATLQSGLNNIVIIASNSCGSDTKSTTVNYNSCVQPQIQLTNTETETASGSYTFSATISGTNVNNGISLLHNGNNLIYTLTGNSLNANLNLAQGSNLISLSVVNSCGSDAKSLTVNYSPCLAPTVSILNPAGGNLIFEVGSLTIQAITANVSSANQVNLSVNGNSITNFSFNNGQVTSTIDLVSGNNVIALSVTTPCGTDSKNIIVIGRVCEAPVISIPGITRGGIRTDLPQYSITGSISGYGLNSVITLSLNGTQIPVTINSNGVFSANVTLNPGLNQCVVNVVNECGTDTETFNIDLAVGSGTNSGGTGGTNNGSNQNSNGNNNSGNGNTNGNNGHGNNADGVDSSNPGQGGGGPNGANDPSGNVDDESTGSGAINSNSNNNGSTENQNSNNSNSGGTEQNTNGNGGVTNEGNQNTNENGSTENQNGNNSNSGGANPNSNGAGGNNNNGGNENTNGNGNTNGNNGHGNNADGVDSSNPGQGGGGPNGVNDPSGNVDDESTGSGAINSNSNNNGSTENQNGNNSNSGGADPNFNGTGGNNNGGNENTNENNNSSNGNTNGNNGHGNNADGVDSSNPGQGGGGPNGVTDPSGNVDDESTGSGAINSNSNNNGSTGNQNGNNSNSGVTEQNSNGAGGATNEGNQNTNENGSTENQNGNNSNSGGANPNSNGTGGNNNGGNENTNENNNSGNGNTNGNGNGNNQEGSSGGNNSGGSGNGNQKNQQINNSGNTRGGSKPTVNQNNSGGNKTPVNQNNSGDNKPTVNQNNSGGNKPTVNQNNSGGNKPTVNQNNSGGNKTNSNTQVKTGGDKANPPNPSNNPGGTKGNKKGGN